MEVVGQEFDFNLYEVVLWEESSEFVEDVVCEEFQCGYYCDGCVLCYVMVKVLMGLGLFDLVLVFVEVVVILDQMVEEF